MKFMLVDLCDENHTEWLADGQNEGINADAAFDLLEFVTNLRDYNGTVTVNNGILTINNKTVNLNELLDKCHAN